MYDYKIVEITKSKMTNKWKENYQEVISTHAQQGWKLHTFTSVASGTYIKSNGDANLLTLIFEKEIN